MKKGLTLFAAVSALALVFAGPASAQFAAGIVGAGGVGVAGTFSGAQSNSSFSGGALSGSYTLNGSDSAYTVDTGATTATLPPSGAAVTATTSGASTSRAGAGSLGNGSASTATSGYAGGYAAAIGGAAKFSIP